MDVKQADMVDHAIKSRKAIRAFLSTPVEPHLIKDILAIASCAPSGSNAQPWNIYVVTGKKRDEIIKKITDIQKKIDVDSGLAAQYQETFPYYPEKWCSPFLDRRRAMGWGLYGILNIEKGDKQAMAAQQLRNFQFFDAPVGLFFTVKKVMGIGAKMDIAMMLQNIMIAAKARGLDTCPQTAWNMFHNPVLHLLNAPEDEELVCALCLGYADLQHQVNHLENPRATVDSFATFLD